MQCCCAITLVLARLSCDNLIPFLIRSRCLQYTVHPYLTLHSKAAVAIATVNVPYKLDCCNCIAIFIRSALSASKRFRTLLHTPLLKP